ncbi:MAG: hypothetical protein QHC90_13515 [Shinella sp.]|nr:hypothetical protein [Shinella sp.]
MEPMKAIRPPDKDAGEGERTAACLEAIKPSFEDLLELAPVNLAATAGDDMPEGLMALAKRAQSVGWSREEAVEAIRKLARRHLGAKGATFD